MRSAFLFASVVAVALPATAQTISIGGTITQLTHLERRGIGVGNWTQLYSLDLGSETYPAPMLWGGAVQCRWISPAEPCGRA